jgi:hypothetical protein
LTAANSSARAKRNLTPFVLLLSFDPFCLSFVFFCFPQAGWQHLGQDCGNLIGGEEFGKHYVEALAHAIVAPLHLIASFMTSALGANRVFIVPASNETRDFCFPTLTQRRGMGMMKIPVVA